ncbi:hypothetical protein ACK8OR_15530 [Jannaschia sp. KMU-145]|uniref:hypothetical protein n=1 Tax=Jannaschia halovivens TaxID=3388667 RepID=UPI00396AF2C0
METEWHDVIGPGERILWTGAPGSRPMLTWATLLIAAFGIPFLAAGIATLSTAAAFLAPNPWNVAGAIALACFALPFLGVGLAMILGPALHHRLGPRRIRYALTDRAAYVATRWFALKLTRIVLDPEAITLTDGPGGGVQFINRVERDSDGETSTRRLGFDALDDPRAVYGLALRAMASEP